MAVFNYHIKVDNGGNAVVTRTPAKTSANEILHISQEDKVEFTSNDRKTVIQYQATSPFTEPELGPHQNFPVGNNGPKGPFQVKVDDRNRRTHRFECGFLDANNKFSLWGSLTGSEEVGDDTPVDP